MTWKAWCAGWLMALASLGSAQAEIVDAILATVGKEAILQSEILSLIGPSVNELRRTVSSEDEFNRRVDALVQQGLEQAIEDKILLREAQLAGIEVDDKAVEQRMEALKKLYPTTEEFNKDLEHSGETLGDLRTRMKKQEMARRMAVQKRSQFEKEVVVSESEVAQYYRDHQSEFNRPERVRCRQIFIPAGADSAERASVKTRVEELKKALAAGGDFGQLAAANSQAPGAEQGGIIGWVQRGDLVEPLEQAAFSLAEGAVSDVIETKEGFSLLKVEKKEAAGLATLDEVRGEIEPKLRQAGADEKYKKWISDLRKRSQVQVYL